MKTATRPSTAKVEMMPTPAIREPGRCATCVLPVTFAGVDFTETPLGIQCDACRSFVPVDFKGAERFLADLDPQPSEKIGITVSGGKDSMFVWAWLAEHLGSERVIAFNHNKMGLVHPLAIENLHRAQEVLGSQLVIVTDDRMLSRLRLNLEALLAKPNPAMVRAVLCAGCRVGISGTMFRAGKEHGVRKFVNASSYLELAPFKGALMRAQGGGSERDGLTRGLFENASYTHGDNIATIMLDDAHCHATQLAAGGSNARYDDVQYFDFHEYLPNDPARSRRVVCEQLGWQSPDRDWHFDCQVEVLKDMFYLGLLGYTELDAHLSAMVRYGLRTREAALDEVTQANTKVRAGIDDVLTVMSALGCAHLTEPMIEFYAEHLGAVECSRRLSA